MTPSPAPSPSPDRPAAPPAAWRRWLHEPLLHFLVLGALLFAVDNVRMAGREDDSTIVVGTAVNDEIRRLYREARGRDPEPAEFAALRQRWIDNEVLYREGLALRVDRGDKAIRDRVVFKSLSVVDASLRLPPYDDALLRAWFEAHRERYDQPARLSFQEAVVPSDMADDAIRRFVDALNAGTAADVQAGLRVFKGRPVASLSQAYGDDFAQALAQAPTGRWQALPTRDGLRAVRLDAVEAAQPAAYEPLRGVVLQDWTDATMAEQRTAAVRALARKYDVRLTEVAP